MDTFVAEVRNNHEVDPNDNVLNTIWNEYERVILKSLFTSKVVPRRWTEL